MALGFQIQIQIPVFGFELHGSRFVALDKSTLDCWLWTLLLGLPALNSLLWIPGFGFLALDSWLWTLGFEFMALD